MLLLLLLKEFFFQPVWDAVGKVKTRLQMTHIELWRAVIEVECLAPL